MRITCCKNCPDRADYGKCHDTCERYQSQKRAELEAMKRYKEKNLGNTQMHQMASDRLSKSLKRKK